MHILRLAITALLVLPLVYCGGDGNTGMPPAEETPRPDAPTAEAKPEVDEPVDERPAPEWFAAIDAINVAQQRLGWKRIHVEDTLDSIQATLGRKISLEKMESEFCGGYYADADDEGMVIELEFESSEPGAKLETLFLRLPPFESDKSGLIERLKSRIPALVYQPSIHAPDLTEDENDGPMYLLRDNPSHVLLIKPWEGILIALGHCLD
jgi:hypothetical protein